MTTAHDLKLFGAMIDSDHAGANYAIILAATADDAFNQVLELAPSGTTIEIMTAEELLWEQYDGFAVLTTYSLYD